MSLTYKRLTAGVAIASIAVLALGAAGYLAGARINTTQSIPVGLYWTSGKPVVKGTYVLFCPPEANVFAVAKARGYIGAGFCPGGYGFMMKRVVAANGDTVSISDDGVRVNAELLPLSVPLRMDKAGRSLERFGNSRFSLDGSEVLLMSDVTGASFDSRYFGPIDRSQIKTVISPVITW
jgi:conjugative transfer signal peptidase TraF